jgi:hypothetical protein
MLSFPYSTSPKKQQATEFEDIIGVSNCHRSNKNRQYNGQKKNDKSTHNNLQNTPQKTKDRATRIPTKI